MQTPSRPSNRPSSAQSRSTTRRFITTMTDSILRACATGGDAEGFTTSSQAALPSNLGIVFNPRRPPSARSIMQRQSRAFHVALLGDDWTEASTHSRASRGGGSAGGAHFFEHVVRPFMVLKGSSDAERSELLLTWALDMAHHCGIAMPSDAARLFVQRVEGQQQHQGVPSNQQGGAAGPPMVSPSESTLTGGGGASAVDDGQHIAFAVPSSLAPRAISPMERAAFLHFVTREANVNGVVMATTTIATLPKSLAAAVVPYNNDSSGGSFRTQKDGDAVDDNRAPPGSGAMAVHLTPLRMLLSPVQCLTTLLRVMLHCASSISRDMSDFDFRKRNRSDRYFSLAQGSDLDSTDEDNDDGAPRPLDTVVLTAAEVLLANFNRLELHDSSGAVRHDVLTQPASVAVIEELTRLVQRLSMDGHAERSFGIMLGLVMQILHVVDARRGALGDSLVPLRRYVEEQAAFYTMKADGATCNRELVDMYERLTEPFYKVVRILRLLDETADALQHRDRPSSGDAIGNEGSAVGSTSQAQQHADCLRVVHQCLERFIYYRSAERAYDREWTHVFHLEMTARERLIEFERERFFAFLWHVKKCVPPHGIHEFISGAKLYRLKEQEGAGRESLLQEEARKHAFLCRILEARCVMPLETDPKRVANHLVPTTRPPTVASVYDYGHHVSRTPSRPLVVRAGSPVRPGSGVRPQSGTSRSMGAMSTRATPQPATSATSAKDAFFLAQRQRDPAAEVRHAESFSRLSVRQAEGDRWFVILLEHQLRLDEMASKTLGTLAHTGASDASMHSVLAASTRDAALSEAWMAREAAVRALSAQETAMRSDVCVEEALEADVVLGSAFVDTIVVPLEHEAEMRRRAEALQTNAALLSEVEHTERVAVEDAEREAYCEIASTYQAAARHMGVVYELALAAAAEDVARRRLHFTEESSFDMLQSMYRLQTQLNRDLFRRSLSEAELKTKLEAIARRRAEDEARMLLLEELAAMKADVLRVESVFRSDLDHELKSAASQLELMKEQSLLSIEERAARKRVALLESIRDFENVSRFLHDGIAQLSREIEGMDHNLEASSSTEAPACSASNERAADDQLAGILRAGQRAEVHLKQQEAHILKGAFRYHLFLLEAQRPSALVDEEPQGRTMHSAVVAARTSPMEGEGLPEEASSQQQHQELSTTDETAVVLPHLQHIRTRTFLRPVSAAVAASTAAGSSNRNDQRRAAAIAKATREFSIAEKMTTFNRIWLSDTSKDHVRAAAAATATSPSVPEGY